jgi:riboflavin synthase
MFTGIVLGKGKVTAMRRVGKGVELSVAPDFVLDGPETGESIAVNGVCLTAREIDEGSFVADVSPETLSRTNLGGLSVGAEVNLERALRLSDRLGGHLVSGHVDATTRVLSRRPEGDYTVFTFAMPAGLERYMVEKGSVTVDGISLTVNSCDKTAFSVAIIPHTLEVTVLGSRRTGDLVNIEADIIGKYVEKMLKTADGGLDEEFLARHGFV